MSVTVEQLKQTNSIVRRMPALMLKDEQEVISEREITVHAVMQGVLYAGFPASTLPGLINNPQLYGMSAGVGVLAGSIFRVCTEFMSPSNTTYGQSWREWLVHSAAMNTLAKGIFVSLQMTGVSGSTLIGVLRSSPINVLCEGVAAGSLAGYEAAGFFMDVFRGVENAQPPLGQNSAEEGGPTAATHLLINQVSV